MEQNSTPETPTAVKQNGGGGWKIATVIASLVAICGIGFGVYGMMQSNQPADLKVQIKEEDGTVTIVETPKVETSTTGETTVTITDMPSMSEEELQHYIYVAQWGVKIALPTSLGAVSYRYYMMPGYTSLGASGVDCSEQGRCQYAPEFADLSKTNSPLGVINRFPKGTEPSAYGGGEKVFTIGDYDYYYIHPQAVYSIESDEQTWEVSSTDLIKEVLTNPDNYSAI